MTWWAWVTVGAVLLISEMSFVDAAFYLIFIGLAALTVGLVDLIGFGGPNWVEWLAFAALSGALMVLFRRRVYEKIRGNLPGYEGKFAGSFVNLPDGLAPGSEARIEFNGSTWTARNTGEQAIPPNGKAVVIEADGLSLLLRSAD